MWAIALAAPALLYLCSELVWNPKMEMPRVNEICERLRKLKGAKTCL
jgi:hypothetical protein